MAVSTLKQQGVSVETVTPINVNYGTFNAVQVYRFGCIVQLYISFKANTQMTSGNEYAIGALPSEVAPMALGFLGGSSSVGSIIASGTMRIRPISTISSGSTLYVTATYMTA